MIFLLATIPVNAPTIFIGLLTAAGYPVTSIITLMVSSHQRKIEMTAKQVEIDFNKAEMAATAEQTKRDVVQQFADLNGAMDRRIRILTEEAAERDTTIGELRTQMRVNDAECNRRLAEQDARALRDLKEMKAQHSQEMLEVERRHGGQIEYLNNRIDELKRERLRYREPLTGGATDDGD